MNGKLTILLFVLGAALIGISQTFFVVDQTQQAIVLQLGQPVGDLRKPGLHVKVPLIQEVRYFDRRILSVDPLPEEMVISSSQITRPAEKKAEATPEEGAGEDAENPMETGEKDEIVIPPISNVSGEPIIVDSFARYRISDPLQFMKTLRSVDNANKRIESIMDEATRTVLGSTTLKELLSSERTRIMGEIRTRLNRKIQEDKMGIEVVDVRIVRADLGESLRDSTVRRMISEMKERATETRAKGEQLALEIRANAEKQRTVILANAERDAQIIRGNGDEEAIQTYASAFNKDREFYAFSRSLEAYKNTMSDQDTRLILSPDSDFFRYFENRPNR
ncbi:MAG: protease modulator HflC [Micavibrio aeruginosavorus]|uniref:Protein HflC n=1 Tax=Micavibrio aeruginosavorus TaxID=349221 RepID=A0A2W4ZXA2_9BACT|nr:MAG: protease modulator HflC [Micavibrio aeruginosavorus]